MERRIPASAMSVVATHTSSTAPVARAIPETVAPSAPFGEPRPSTATVEGTKPAPELGTDRTPHPHPVAAASDPAPHLTSATIEVFGGEPDPEEKIGSTPASRIFLVYSSAPRSRP